MIHIKKIYTTKHSHYYQLVQNQTGHKGNKMSDWMQYALFHFHTHLKFLYPPKNFPTIHHLKGKIFIPASTYGMHWKFKLIHTHYSQALLLIIGILALYRSHIQFNNALYVYKIAIIYEFNCISNIIQIMNYNKIKLISFSFCH